VYLYSHITVHRNITEYPNNTASLPVKSQNHALSELRVVSKEKKGGKAAVTFVNMLHGLVCLHTGS